MLDSNAQSLRLACVGAWLVALLAVAGCGGGGGGGEGSTTPPAPPATCPPGQTGTPPNCVTPPVPAQQVTVSPNDASPVPRDLLRTTSGFFDVFRVDLNDTGTDNKPVPISSVSIEGTLAPFITQVRVVDGANVLGTAPASNNRAAFGISVQVPTAGKKTLIVQAEWDLSGMPAFAPDEPARKVRVGLNVGDITLSGAGGTVVGLPTFGGYVYVENEKMAGLIGPCSPLAECTRDLQTGVLVVRGGIPDLYPSTTVSSRTESVVALTVISVGGRIDTWLLSLSDQSTRRVITSIAPNWAPLCTTIAHGGFDITHDFIVFSSDCSGGGPVINQAPNNQVVVVMPTDGSMRPFAVSNDGVAADFSPAFCSGVRPDNTVDICFGGVGGERGPTIGIWKVKMDLTNGAVGQPVRIVDTGFKPGTYIVFDLLAFFRGPERLFAVNKAYDQIVFTNQVLVQQLVGCEPNCPPGTGNNLPPVPEFHIATVSVNGGVVTDLGKGRNPSADGSGRILFSCAITAENDCGPGNGNDFELWMMNFDGSDRRRIVPPKDMTNGIVSSTDGTPADTERAIVFAPAGF